MQTKVLIVGGGEIGQAVAFLLRHKRATEVIIWDINPRLCTGSKDLAAAAAGANFLFLCIPSHAIDRAAGAIKKLISWRTIIVSLTKGLERKEGKLASTILREHFGRRRTSLLAGPMLAEELGQGLATAAVLAGNKATYRKVASLFAGTKLTLHFLTDVHGVAAASVLKNVYALGLGTVDALELGANAKGVFLQMAVGEMQQLLPKLGGKEKTAFSLAGLGDLEATANSPHSENRTTGQSLVRSRRTKMISEGAMSLPLLLKRLKGTDLPPFLRAIKMVVINKHDPRKTFTAILSK